VRQILPAHLAELRQNRQVLFQEYRLADLDLPDILA
jgi:hypothetical protein